MSSISHPNKLNEKARDELLGMLNKDDMPVVFIGAGLSYPAYPLWGDLMGDLAKGVGYPVDKLSGNPLSDASVLYRHNERVFKDTILNKFCPEPATCSSILRHIAKIDFDAFLTTNFDRSTDRAFRGLKREFDSYSSASFSRLLSSLCCSQNLFFIHGRVENDFDQELEIVLTGEEYKAAYSGAKGHVATFLFDVFAQKNVIFTGFSFHEHEPLNYILLSLIEMRNRYKTKAPEKDWKILITSEAHNDSDFLDRLKSAKVKPIYFDKGDDDFSGLNWVWGQVADSFLLENSDPLKISPDPISIPIM